MASTRKRKRAKTQLNGKRDSEDTTAEFPDSQPSTKKSRGQRPLKTQWPVSPPQSLPINHPVLSLYFPTLLPLRTFLEQILSFLSKTGSLRKLAKINQESDSDLSLLLDTALVGLKELRTKYSVPDIEDATQSSGCSRPASSSQSEIVDLTLHTLFYRSLSTSRANNAVYPGKPNNILAQGYSINNNRYAAQGFNAGPLGIDIVNFYPNTHIGTLKSPMWSRLFKILGDEIMLDLLLNTSIFPQLYRNSCDAAKANYYQLTGPPLSDFLNKPSIAPTTNTSLQRSSVAAVPGTRSAGAPLKRPVSEIECAGAKLIDKKIKPNRPAAAAAYLTNRNCNKNSESSNNSNPNDQRSSNQKLQNVKTAGRDLRTPGEIIFIRSRMFYSKPAFNIHGEVQFGLRHIHVLNRFSDASLRSHTVHALKYIFPRQFKLHNVFTSPVDRKETIQAFKDYTVREQEIDAVNRALKPGAEVYVPKRLRGATFELVARMQRLHKRCSYHELVKYYCPVSSCDEGVFDRRVAIPEIDPSNSIVSNNLVTQANFPSLDISTIDTTSESSSSIVKQKNNFTDFASTSGEVSAFARAVIGNVIPREFWGKGLAGEANRKVIMDNVDRFVKMRRFESFSLHEVMQGLKLAEFAWLSPTNTPSTTKLSLSDTLKRRELLAEFLYWLFDSFLVPLLQTNFYITESNVHRNRIFYFRHDMWRKLGEPVLNTLKTNMFVELETEKAKQILAYRQLGYAQVRLLPKENGARPIMNLRRRALKKDKWKGKITLMPSINSIMTPVQNVLTFEKSRNMDKVGSSMFCVGDMHPKLKGLQTRIKEKGWIGRKLYFAKVDVQACFDTIPQQKLLRLIDDIIIEDEYRIQKYAEIKPPQRQQSTANAQKPIKRFLAKASLADDFIEFKNFAKTEVAEKRHTVFVDDVVHQFKTADDLLALLDEHVRRNIIKIGKKYFRQKNGIPQGSVLSTLLCSFFYGDLEQNKLSFTQDEDGVLLRLIDDFLFITLDKGKAKEFLKVMHEGHPEYGAFVSIKKSLCNFDMSIGGRNINRLIDTLEFPYCGNLVHMKTLGIRKDRDRKISANINDLLTVDYSKAAGRALHRKVVSSFQIQTHPMYFDTDFNNFQTVLKNIYHSFIEAGMKFHRAVRALAGSKQPSESLLINITSDLLDLAVLMLKKPGRASRCAATRAQIRWLGAQAFKKTLEKKQTKYRGLMSWLDNTMRNETPGAMTMRIPSLGDDPFQSFRY